jgi:hypothetical protein
MEELAKQVKRGLDLHKAGLRQALATHEFKPFGRRLSVGGNEQTDARRVLGVACQ